MPVADLNRYVLVKYNVTNNGIFGLYCLFCDCVDAGITLVLALSVYQMIINEKLPATSDAVPLLGKLVCM